MLLWNMAMSGCLWVLADFISQALEYFVKETGGWRVFCNKYSTARTLRFCIFGGLIFAPIADTWFGFLVQKLPGDKLTTALQRMAADQTIFSPFILSLMLTALTLMEGKTLAAAQEKIAVTMWPTLKSNWCYWPIVQTVNMWIIPPAYRLLFANVMSIPWNVFIAWQVSKPVVAVKSAGGSVSSEPALSAI